MSLGKAIRRKRNEEDLTLRDVGKAMDLAPTTISRYENDKRRPSDRILEDLAELLGTTPEELEELADQIADEDEVRKGEERVHLTAPSHYVTSKEEISDWRNRVIRDTHLSEQQQMILMALPAFMDEISWVIPISQETFIQETGRDRSMVEEHWKEVVGSDYIERLGNDAKWVFRLTLPD